MTRAVWICFVDNTFPMHWQSADTDFGRTWKTKTTYRPKAAMNVVLATNTALPTASKDGTERLTSSVKVQEKNRDPNVTTLFENESTNANTKKIVSGNMSSPPTPFKTNVPIRRAKW
jgi:hypothetical protein